MRMLLFILLLALIFALGFGLFMFVAESYLKMRYRQNIDQRIKDTLFKELGFTYRETAAGKRFLVIDEYKGGKAIKV